MKQWANHSLNQRVPYRLILLFVAALTVTLVMADRNLTAEAFFQSPASPVEEPPQPPPVDLLPPQPDEVPVSPVMPGQPDNTAPSAAPLPAAVPTLPRPSRVAPLPGNAPEAGSSNLVVDQAEMIDTVVVTTAYVWLCCGIIAILLIPLIFLFLHIRGRSKILKEEQRF
jgi:hypothetical protein